MAEERLIDDDIDKNGDKEKKYRFHINEDGEEELVIEQPEKDEESAEEDGAGYAFDEEEDENRYDAQEERRAIENLIALARADADEGKFSTALELVTQAAEIDADDGEVAALSLEIYTRGLTDFSGEALYDAAEAAKKVAEFSDGQTKEALFQKGGERLNSVICGLQSQVDELEKLNEQGKAERAVRFNADNKKAAIKLVCFFVPFAVLLGLAIYYFIQLADDMSILNIVLTSVFAGLALVFLVACMLAARTFATTMRRVLMNRDNSRTQVGRDYEAAKSRLTALRTIYDAISGK